MNRDKFKRLAIGHSVRRLKINEEFVASLPILQSMDTKERSLVADSLIILNFLPGQCVFKQDDHANGMYFIEEGTISIIKNEHSPHSSIYKKLEVGDYFGEVALISNFEQMPILKRFKFLKQRFIFQDKALRSASAYVDKSNEKPARLAFLGLDAFRRLIKDETIELIKKNMESYVD